MSLEIQSIQSSKFLSAFVLATLLFGCDDEAKKEPPAAPASAFRRGYPSASTSAPDSQPPSSGTTAPTARAELVPRLNRVWAKAIRG